MKTKGAKNTARRIGWTRHLWSCLVATAILLIYNIPAYATFLGHWAPATEARVEQLMSERVSSDIYDVEEGGNIDLALYYAMRGQSLSSQNADDIPKLKPYLDTPLSEPLKADVFIALTSEALDNADFDSMSEMSDVYIKEVASPLRQYTYAYGQTIVLSELGLYSLAENSLNELQNVSSFQDLPHFSRDRTDSMLRSSQNAFRNGDYEAAISRAQQASIIFISYNSLVGASSADTKGMKTRIELALAEAWHASGQVDLAERHLQTALSYLQSSNENAIAVRAQVIQGEISILKSNFLAARKQFETLLRNPNYNSSGSLGPRVYDGLALAYEGNGSTQNALKYYKLAKLSRQTIEQEQSLLQSRYLAAQMPNVLKIAGTDVSSSQTIAVDNPQPDAGIDADGLADSQKLIYLGFALAILGILFALYSQIRVGRARRALELYSKSLEQSERLARQNAERAEDNMQLAEAASNAKTVFLANMSHEIRTPMNGVLGMADVLRRTTELDQRQSDIVEIIHSSATSLMSVLGDFLDFSKMESGDVELNTHPANLREAVESVAGLMSGQAREKGLEIFVRYDPKAPEVLIMDIGRVRQILLNLVGNAIKFTKKGHVLINVDIAVDGLKAKTTINVLDTGIGISTESQKIIFENFMQGQEGRNKRYNGTGLGLSISKKLTQIMGGKISVRSNLDEGSVFTLELPLSLDVEEAPALRQFDAGRILLIDNNATSLKIYAAQLKAWGLQTTVARSSKDGLAGLLHAKDRGEAFSAIIIDKRCDGENEEFIDVLNANAAVSQTPVILLSDVPGCETNSQHKYSAHVGKPIAGHKLFSALEAALSKVDEAKSETLVTKRLRPVLLTPAPERKLLRVLLAEANPATRHVIATFLEDKSVQIHSVGDGEQALENAKSIDFDIIFMDAQLSKLDGFLATRAIRGHEKETNAIRTPIICLSPYALGADQDLAIAVGMDDFLVKPLTPTDLEDVMKKWGGLKGDIRAVRLQKRKGQNKKIVPNQSAESHQKNVA